MSSLGFGGGGGLGFEGGGGGFRRPPWLTFIMYLTALLTLLFGLALMIIFLVTLSWREPAITWYLAPLWVPFGVGSGTFLIATIDSRQLLQIFFQPSIIATVLCGIGLIFNIVAGYYYGRLWIGCVIGWIALRDNEKIMCKDENWLVWITGIWALLFLLLALGSTLSAGWDAFMRITRTNLFGIAQRGFEGASDVFGQPFQRAFSRVRRSGRRPSRRDEEEDLGLEDEGEFLGDEGGESIAVNSKFKNSKRQPQKINRNVKINVKKAVNSGKHMQRKR